MGGRKLSRKIIRMAIQKRLYFFVPLYTTEGGYYTALISKYRFLCLQRGIQCIIHDSAPIGIPPAVIYLVGQNHIVATAQAVNDAVIQKLLSINIVIQQSS
jgi:hypothetical protein